MNINTKDREFINKGFAGIKKDIAEIKNDIVGVKNDVADVKNDIVGVKNDVADVKKDFKREINGLKTEMKDGISGLKTDIEKLAQASQEQFLIIRDDINEIKENIPTNNRNVGRLKAKIGLS